MLGSILFLNGLVFTRISKRWMLLVSPKRLFTALFLFLLLGLVFDAMGASLMRIPVEPGVHASLRGGRLIFVECNLPRGDAAKPLLEKYLLDPKLWTQYRGRMTVAIPYDKLNVKARRQVLEALFPFDWVDDQGWWHVVATPGEDGTETWSALAEWLTGQGGNEQKIRAHAQNQSFGEVLDPGQTVLIPRAMLPEAMRGHRPRRMPPPLLPAAGRPAEPAAAPARLPARDSTGELTYHSDARGAYAEYRLKPGEALYTAVVVRFTDIREHADIAKACETIQLRSGIQNVHRMKNGQRILIPLEMLADRYQPEGTEQRIAYEAVREEAQRLQATRVRTQDLEGVVVILDPGHGGRDQGAAVRSAGLYEDELNYDIACRIKRILETETRAKVYMTMRDRSQGFNPTEVSRFMHDEDEELLTTPPYPNTDARVSAYLRAYLANHIYRQERARGVDDRKILFASIHCDALFNASLRGAMIYVPGASYRSDREMPSGAIFDQFEESRKHRAFLTTVADRRRDEALSRNFANTVLHSLSRHDPPIKVHDTGDPIRNVIRQSGGRAYVPAVLRNTLVPTKVLIECANLTNPTDQANLANPKWRQWFAEAFVDALRRHFDS